MSKKRAEAVLGNGIRIVGQSGGLEELKAKLEARAKEKRSEDDDAEALAHILRSI